ncbi:Kunitz/Bovine pancreatic trypsin inhibitor domain protein [Ancylostoma duodenale]|uniref:Kunitz/Bovine pancreatic trypsin inhibitor domain protein n=1 Tax=Ancylostoma duodenale TaxID=51022 RepID=A0A0C2DMZ8_9BILA|nr:Kunitz/Bovine pancreatic trypsin inhibitor domain protein [Ancylostoma duodenale]
MSRPKDLCDEPLHPRLEEDCNNENWELRWFFNKKRGACKSFWYGGCEADARNFFGDIKVQPFFVSGPEPIADYEATSFRVARRLAATNTLSLQKR